jgi:DNA repair protein RadC
MLGAAMSAPQLMVKGAGRRYREARPDEIRAAVAQLAARAMGGQKLAAPREAMPFLIGQLWHLEHECFGLVWLDNRHQVLAWDPIFRGTIDKASVHPREVVKHALLHNAAAVIIAHNHPSGVGEPSQADELITRRIRDALALVDIRVVDHILVAGPTTAQCVSFAERGLL